ncbi:hypothetical protein L596_015479 [Steinernema carpocapsae]|uniref:Uncharacterized protein n=1 Tax=Steinernema carpocapsae TaxID=34508 RepID=A0A4U5NF38_STECR|nr:hypothetical protein L596_015479 [Steinernema carpocapsae]
MCSDAPTDETQTVSPVHSPHCGRSTSSRAVAPSSKLRPKHEVHHSKSNNTADILTSSESGGYYIFEKNCTKACKPGPCRPVDLDNLYNIFIIDNKHDLLPQLFDHRSAGAVCGTPRIGLRNPLKLESATYFMNNTCNGDCGGLSCIRHVPNAAERKLLYNKQLDELLLYKCAPFPPWAVLVICFMILVLIMITLIAIRYCCRKRKDDSGKSKMEAASEKAPTPAPQGWVNVNPPSVTKPTEQPKPTSMIKATAPEKVSKVAEHDSAKLSKRTQSVTVTTERDVNKESKVHANTWVVDAVSEDQ